jgi:integrase
MKGRNAKGGGSIRQREDGTWEARCTINGKRRSFYGKKQSEVLKEMRAAQSAADNGTFIEPSKMTIEQWLNTWLEEYIKPSSKPLTYSAYKSKVYNHIIPGLGGIRLTSLNPTQVQAFYNSLLREKGLSPKSIKDVHGILHRAIEQALELRYIPYNYTNACKRPRIVKKEIEPFDDIAVEAFLTAIKGHRYQDIFTVTLFTGMREGEVCGLPWDAVDFRNGTITVKQQLCKEKEKGGKHYIDTPKHDKVRILTAPSFVMDILREVKAKQLQNHLECIGNWQNEHNLVFTDEFGKYTVPATLHKHFKIIARQIGRPDARFHDLRHTYAVTALQEGDDAKTVQQNLGHATAAFTLNVYGHVSEKMKKDSADRMERYYQRVKS